MESVLSIASNITEQELIDAALRESKARLEFTLAAAHVGEWEIDVASGESRHSDLYDRCFGYAAPVPGWNLEMLYAHLHPDDRERVRALVDARVRDAHRSRRSRPASIWPDGSEHWIDVHGSPYVSARASERENAAPALPGHHRRHHAAQAHRGHAARRRPAQGRVPRHAGARTAQPAGADPQRGADHAAVARRGDARQRAQDHRAPAEADGAPGRRPAGRQPHQPGQGGAAAGAGGRGRRRARRDRDQPSADRRRPPPPDDPAGAAARADGGGRRARACARSWPTC